MSSSALVHTVVTSPSRADGRATRPRILIVRSCRMAQLLSAVVMARTKNRDAEIVVLSHRGHRHLLRAAGADRVIEVGGRRFGLLKTAPWTLKRLRGERFHEVVIPQMNANTAAHVNIYQVVAAIQPARVTVVPGTDAPETYEGRAFAEYAIKHTAGAVGRWERSTVVRMLLGLFVR